MNDQPTRLPMAAELCRRRCTAGWSQRDVARRLGVNQTTVSAWETGRRAIPADRAEAYAALLNEIEAGDGAA